MQRRGFLSMTLLCLGALTAQAADVGGQWIAQIPREGAMIETTFTFKVAGDKLTGSTANQFGEREISDGKAAGDDISFNVKFEFGTFIYTGKVSANEIKFTRERKGGGLGPPKVEFTAKRKS
ncbi:MAG: hypothetical protein ACRD8O_09075 [Bryobacteraceae bacterium]